MYTMYIDVIAKIHF